MSYNPLNKKAAGALESGSLCVVTNLQHAVSKAALFDLCCDLIAQLNGCGDSAVTPAEFAEMANPILACRGDGQLVCRPAKMVNVFGEMRSTGPQWKLSKAKR
jgi:hypothetical protein